MPVALHACVASGLNTQRRRPAQRGIRRRGDGIGVRAHATRRNGKINLSRYLSNVRLARRLRFLCRAARNRQAWSRFGSASAKQYGEARICLCFYFRGGVLTCVHKRLQSATELASNDLRARQLLPRFA